MPLMIMYGPVVDGEIDPERCNCRPAHRYTETVEPEDDEDDGVRIRYAIPEGRTIEEFTVTELNQQEAEELAIRVTTTAQEVNDAEWSWKVVGNDD